MILIERSKSDHILQHSLISFTDHFKKDLHRFSNSGKRSETNDFFSDLNANMMSDSIILSIPYDANVNGIYHGLNSIINSSNYIQTTLIGNDLLSRGYLTIGDIHHFDGNFIGPGFIEAYRQEKDIGNHPFVFIDDKIMNDPKLSKKKETGEVSPLEYIIEEKFKPDTKHYLHYLKAGEKHGVPFFDDKDIIKLSANAKEQINHAEKNKDLKKVEREKITNKWSAHLKYLNNILNQDIRTML